MVSNSGRLSLPRPHRNLDKGPYAELGNCLGRRHGRKDDGEDAVVDLAVDLDVVELEVDVGLVGRRGVVEPDAGVERALQPARRRLGHHHSLEVDLRRVGKVTSRNRYLI